MEDERDVDTQTTADNAQNEQKTVKNEGDKSKKNAVAKANEDGSITFKNQDELDGFISRMFAKGAKKAEKGQQNNEQSNTKDETQETQQIASADYSDKIALALVEADVNPKKARRASRLIDTSKVLVNGVLDEAKLKEEIEATIAEFPELKNTATEDKEEKGFKFGSAGSDDEGLKSGTKKVIPKKKWNRFN